MRSATIGALIICVTLTGIPVSAQAQDRGVAADHLTPANWDYVRRLAPGTEVNITTRHERLGRRVFVAANESALTVLNVTHPAITPAAENVLIDLAVSHPEAFEDDEISGTFLNGSIRVGRAGVFDERGKVVDIDQVVETIDRSEIAALDTSELTYTHELARGMPKGLLWTGVGLLAYSGVLLRLDQQSRGNEFLKGAGVFAASGVTLLVIGAGKSHSRLPDISIGRRRIAIEKTFGSVPRR